MFTKIDRQKLVRLYLDSQMVNKLSAWIKRLKLNNAYLLLGVILLLLCLPPSVTGEVYCFPRRQLIFSFGRRVIYYSKGLWEYIPK